MQDMYNIFNVQQVIDPANTTTDVNGDTVDLQGYEGVLLAVSVGESGDSLSGSVKIELEVEHADDDGNGSPDTWTDVADDDLLNFVAGTNDGCFGVIDAAAEDDAVYTTSYIGTKRYVRVVANLVGSHSTGTPIGAIAVKGFGRHQPSA